MVDNGLKNYLHVEKPWGSFDQYTLNEATTVKILTIKTGQRLSLQSHTQRTELWIALDVGLVVMVNDQEIKLQVGEKIFIPVGSSHRATFLGQGQGRILEISFGHFDEMDITRYQDDYQRN
ncbi:MAG: phosphomannose isomerase type II C-terminal cupin domain [Patescibacteria group bacterium]